MDLYFPKGDFYKYNNFDRYDFGGYDLKTTFRLHYQLSGVFNSLVDNLKGRVVGLYCKSNGYEKYAEAKLNTTVAVHRVLFAEVVYKYSGWLYRVFEDFNKMCRMRQHIRVFGKLKDLFRGKPSYRNSVPKTVFLNTSVCGILDMGIKYGLPVMSREFLFNYLFAKYIVELGDSKFEWITDEDIDTCYEALVLDLQPYFDERVALMEEAVKIMKKGGSKRPEYIVLSYLRKKEIIDVDLPLDLMTEMINNGYVNPAYYIRKACYDLWKKGIIEGVEGEYTFLDAEGKIMMPRKFRLKK